MINKLTAKIQKTKAPIVVGLDPMLSYIPKHIQEKAFHEFGETLERDFDQHNWIHARSSIIKAVFFQIGRAHV